MFGGSGVGGQVMGRRNKAIGGEGWEFLTRGGFK